MEREQYIQKQNFVAENQEEKGKNVNALNSFEYLPRIHTFFFLLWQYPGQR